ncbi:hypothetical protein [Caballeronia sp. SL2Y3]|uniref:hypothetical protein n=1 Tax=Caballeronia sp. SL2Y3 TaxID=2878151 RepID=UPI001FD254D9|nr:hypothetical protein [Caballeronia sp. SL2Y3]
MRFPIVLTILLTISLQSLAEDGGRRNERHFGRHSYLKVFDARGQLIGRLGNNASQEGVFLRVDGALVFAPVRHKQLSSDQWSASQFEWRDAGVASMTTDCVSIPGSSTAASPRPVLLIRQGPEVTMFIAGTNDSGGVSGNDSYWRRGCAPGSSLQADEWAPQASYSLTEHYPEPLSIRY